MISTTRFTPELAKSFANMVLAHIDREYPNKLTHQLRSADDVRSPKALYPVFYGCYDWHSCVHGFWLLARILKRYPHLPEGSAIIDLFEQRLSPENVAAELAYMQAPGRAGFERPYGWAWMFALQQELDALPPEHGQQWARALAPLTDAFRERLLEFLPKATYPTRVGTHFNSAFVLLFSLSYARQAGHQHLETLINDTARRWYLDDAGCQAWEPGGDEFLSPALMEAELMRHVLSADQFNAWFTAFLPQLSQRRPATLFVPATVSDRSDGKIAHLDGLNLSRSWCQRSLAQGLPPGDSRIAVLSEAADVHLADGLAHVSGDYMGEHWLATFAVMALEA
jgi:hypothetical protein